MKRFVIKQTDSTLEVDFNPETSTLAMRGESYPENAIKFFSPIISWCTDYFSELEKDSSVQVDMDIVYFNSSSSKALMNLFDIFDSAAKRAVNVSIIWRHHVENEIAQECGEEFGEELEAAGFEMIPYEESS